MARILFIACLVLSFLSSFANAGDGISAKAYLLLDSDTFKVISGRNYHEKFAPASTTKVMTTILALENLDGNEPVVPEKRVLRIPRSKLNLVPGKTYKAMDLIKGSMIQSANDAAYTLGTYIAGSEEEFARMMNEKAGEIGAKDTHFRNASGLYARGQYTTCYDLAVIFNYALSKEVFRDIVTTKYFLFRDGKRLVRYQNHNRFLFCFEPAVGGKTGYTMASRHSYVGAFEKDGKTYILSILGSEDKWGDAVKILENLYDKLPSSRAIQSAKASSVTLSAYKSKKPKKKPVAKKKYIRCKKAPVKSARAE